MADTAKGYAHFDVVIDDQIGGELDRYVDWGMPPSPFVAAVISDKLLATFAFGREDTLPQIGAILHYLLNNAPGACWTCEENFNAWVAKGGRQGLGKPQD